MNDIYNLSRFQKAQDSIYKSVISELNQGEKHGCWMWYIFPQVKGLGDTSTSIYYSISSKEEAIAYLAHPVLGERIKECTQLVLNIEGRSAYQIFHNPDCLKFRSSITLFDCISGDENVFRKAINKYFSGIPDPRTIDILEIA